MSINQIFCIALKIDVPFDLIIRAIKFVTFDLIFIKINYNNLPIWCPYHLSIIHLVKEYKTLYGIKRQRQLEIIVGTYSKGATISPSPTIGVL